MMDSSWVCTIIALAMFWVCLYLDGFAVGSDRLRIFKWAFISLVLGWLFIFVSRPDIFNSFAAMTVSDWGMAIVVVIPFVTSALGVGYLGGRLSHIALQGKVAK
jgi:hypothetical protein